MTEYLKAWQCIGCGRLESSAPCVGVCRDRSVTLVRAEEHEAALAEAAARSAGLEGLVRQLATLQPRDGQWEASFRYLQQRARQVLEEHRAATDGLG